MNEYEKDIMKLFDTHEKADKCELIKRINWEIEMGGIKRYGKNDWVCKVTGSPMGTVCTWFTMGKLWNDRYGSHGLWTWQSKEVQREFIDKLYLERLAEQQAEKSVG